MTRRARELAAAAERFDAETAALEDAAWSDPTPVAPVKPWWMRTYFAPAERHLYGAILDSPPACAHEADSPNARPIVLCGGWVGACAYANGPAPRGVNPTPIDHDRLAAIVRDVVGLPAADAVPDGPYPF